MHMVDYNYFNYLASIIHIFGLHFYITQSYKANALVA